MKKQIILGMATLMFAGMLSTETVSAAEPTGTPVPVSYDNRNNVTDPDDPLAEWSVSIPTAVAFTKDKKTADVGLELVAINGANLADLPASLSIDVKAKSARGLQLTEPEGETMAYGVTYGSNSLSGTTELKVATLTKAAATQAGEAKIADGAKPTKFATYSDTLTYTITKAAVVE